MSIVAIDIKHKDHIYEDYKEDHYWYDPVTKKMSVYNCTYLEYGWEDGRLKPIPINKQIKTSKKHNNIDKIEKILNDNELETLFQDNDKVITQIPKENLTEIEDLLDNENLTFEIISA